jgi:SAM-dependent methyltransferase
MNFRTIAKKGLGRMLAQQGLAITRITGPMSDYLDAKETISGAERVGLSVCDYLEERWAQQGATQRIIEQMASCGAFDAINPNVLEIGTGSGRYLEKVLQRCEPGQYESYEIARDWAEWLKSTYPIVSHETDGQSLRQTADDSVDLVHAHGVFVYLPFVTSYRYWVEVWRVVKNGGFVVFDIMSEDCLDENTMVRWLNSKETYPCFLSTRYVTLLFFKHGFSLISRFNSRMGEGRSEYLVFTRNLSVGAEQSVDA